MSISEEKLYTDPGSEEEQFFENEPKRRTGAKKGKGKKIALVLLVSGGLIAGTIFGTKAVHSHQETKRVDTLITSYQTDDYVILPDVISSDRSYDVTLADGKIIVKRLEANDIEYLYINDLYYTPDAKDIAILTYEVEYVDRQDAIKITNEGTTMYVAPEGYTLAGGSAVRRVFERKVKIVPVATDYSYIRFDDAVNWTMVEEPKVVKTLPYEMIEGYTLICNVPDGASLNDINECFGSLELAPKKR